MEIKKLKTFNYILQAIFISPVIYIFINSFNKLNKVSWIIIKNELVINIINTALIVIPTMLLTVIIGFFLAYYETFYDFKLRKFFNYVNILAFCIPSYILSYIYYDLFSSYFYYHFKVSYDISNKYFAIILLSLAFYPYIYIFSKSYLKKIPENLLDASTLLGKSSFKTFLHIILPLSKPTLLFASMLVMIESINAYGLPSYFGIQVFSTSIYKVFINTFDINASFLLSTVLLLFIFIIMFIILKIIGYNNKYTIEINSNYTRRKKLSFTKAIIVQTIFIIIFLLSFVIPVLYLMRFAYYSYMDVDYFDILKLTSNTFLLTSVSSLVITIFTLFILQINRLRNNNFKSYSKVFILSYAVPGSVISLTLTYLFISFDKFMFNDNLVISKSFIVVLLAYLYRFIVISYTNINSSINKIGNSYYEASLLLSKSRLKSFFKVDMPMLNNAILSSFILLFVEIIKELPLTSINGRIETLAIRIDYYSADEAISYIGIPSLILIFLCFIAICLKIYIEKRDK